MFIRMMGQFEVQDASGRNFTPRGAKARALLAMLCRTPGHRRPRRWLEARLWSDRGQEQASGSLRQALTELRKALGPLAGHLASDRDCVTLADFASDLTPEPLRQALDAGREFLEGIDITDPAFNQWLAHERQLLAVEGSVPEARKSTPLSLRLADLPEGTDTALVRAFASAVGRLAAEYLLVQPGLSNGLPMERLDEGLDLQIDGTCGDERAFLKLRLVDPAAGRTVWSQRLVASRSPDGRSDATALVFETTEAALM